MDIRALLLGLGSGMLAATVIIGVGEALSTDNAQNTPAPQERGAVPATPAVDWAKSAREAGMVVLSQAEFEQKIAQAKTDGAKAKETELANKPTQPVAPATVRVYIQSGMGTKDVGQLLKAAGVIADVNEFVVARQSHNSPIRAGIYELRLKMTPQEVFKVVATVP